MAINARHLPLKMREQLRAEGVIPETKPKYFNRVSWMCPKTFHVVYEKRNRGAGYLKFDSIHERKRYIELALMQRRGEIWGLKTQERFDLLTLGGKKVAEYRADFTYIGVDGRKVVEDAKGKHTAMYLLKKRWMLAQYGIEIMEV